MNASCLLLIGVAVCGCVPATRPQAESVSPSIALQPQIQPGPARDREVHRVLVLAPSCGSVDFSCPPEYLQTVANISSSGMEFSGYTVILSESLRKETRQRHETVEREKEQNQSQSTTSTTGTWVLDKVEHSQHASEGTREKTTVVLDGPGFDDLPVDERKAIINASGADAILSVRVIVGAQTAWTANQTIEVMARLGADQGDSMVQAARCYASASQFGTPGAALEAATRCALQGLTQR